MGVEDHRERNLKCYDADWILLGGVHVLYLSRYITRFRMSRPFALFASDSIVPHIIYLPYYLNKIMGLYKTLPDGLGIDVIIAGG